MKGLEPDKYEFQVAGHQGMLKACPFCGRDPLITSQYNETTKIYGATIICEAFRCGVTLHSNGLSRDEARQNAIRNWSKRM